MGEGANFMIENYQERKENFLKKFSLFFLSLLILSVVAMGMKVEYANPTVLSYRKERVVDYGKADLIISLYPFGEITATKLLPWGGTYEDKYYVKLTGGFGTFTLNPELNNIYCIKTYQTNITHRIINSIYPYTEENCPSQ
jgi:hypothetical protein